MSNGVFNIAKGRVNAYVSRVANSDPTNAGLVILVLKTSEADSTLLDYTSISALLASAGNEEADFTNYARKVLTSADVPDPTPDHGNDIQNSDFPDQTFASAGGTTDNTTAKVIVAYDPDTTSGDDTTLIPLTHHDWVGDTNGSDIVVQIAASGFYSAG
jgi:hypothetical protein